MREEVKKTVVASGERRRTVREADEAERSEGGAGSSTSVSWMDVGVERSFKKPVDVQKQGRG